MTRRATAIAATLLVLTLAGCSSKSPDQVAVLEARMGEMQRGSQDRMDGQARQVAALAQQFDELNSRVAALDRQLSAQEASLKVVSEYLERYDATWSTFSRLQTEYDNELKQIRDQQSAATNALTEARRELETNLRSANTEMLSVRNDLRQRIDRTNADVFSLRAQSKEKLDDMTAALKHFGEAIQEILILQRSQFQDMTDAYSRSLSDIEPYLPEAMLSNINTPELLVSPNPDVQQPNQSIPE